MSLSALALCAPYLRPRQRRFLVGYATFFRTNGTEHVNMRNNVLTVLTVTAQSSERALLQACNAAVYPVAASATRLGTHYSRLYTYPSQHSAATDQGSRALRLFHAA